MTLDIERLKEAHGLAQARRESAHADPLATRVGTKLFRDGHRKGFWDGVRHVLENPAAFAEHLDWRVISGVQTGYVPARWLRLGDRVIIAEVEGIVARLSLDEPEKLMHLTIRTAGGAQIVFERTAEYAVRVLAFGEVR